MLHWGAVLMNTYLPPITLTTADIILSLSPLKPYDKWLPTWEAHMMGMLERIYV